MVLRGTSRYLFAERTTTMGGKPMVNFRWRVYAWLWISSTLLWGCTAMAQATPVQLRCVAEKSDYLATATYDEVRDLCRALADQSPHVRLGRLGFSSQGREIPLLIVSRKPPASPEDLGARLPILVLGNIHAGEVCGKEAILMLACEIAAGKHASLLDDAVFLLAPIYNADGNQPVSPENRPAQHGPAGGVGLRVNGQGLDLNRDHVKLESPEAVAFVRALRDWDPAMVIDTHTTNGSYHRFALTYDGPRNAASPRDLITYVRDDFLPTVGRRMLAQSGFTSFYYGNFSDDHRQWQTYPAWPRYGTQYVAVRGRISILSEAYAYISYRERVLATRQFVLECWRLAVERRASIAAMLQADRDTWSRMTESQPRVAIRSEPVPLSERFTALGFDDGSLPSDARPGTLPTIEQNFSVEFVGEERPTVEVRRPFAYAIPASWQKVIENLAAHGIRLDELTEEVEVPVVAARITDVQREEEAFQGHRLLEIQVTDEASQQMLPAGTIVVRTQQDLGRLAILLLEPMSQDGLVSWNFFDQALAVDELFPVLRIERTLPLPLRERPAAE